MTRLLYSLVLYLSVPLVLLRLLWRGTKNPAYWRRWSERFGWFAAPSFKQPLWIHAVSVGEVQAAVPLVRALLARYPQRSVVITAMTPTGSQRAQALFAKELQAGRVFHVYLPYDLPGAVRRFLKRVQPCIAIIMETELWPNLFHHCARKNIPVVVANARLSPKSLAGYQRMASLVRPTLAKTTLIASQSEADAERFLSIGAKAEQVMVMGNIKFDLHFSEDLPQRAKSLRAQLGAERPVWIAASTHEGEEEQVLQAFALVREVLPQCLLVLVPRHPERFNKVVSLAQRHGYQVLRRTEGQSCDAGKDVFVVDTLGELPLFYAAADVAFVGGSLVPTGGHNMLEPAALGLPVIIGPHLFNFAEVSSALLAVGGACKVDSPKELARKVREFLQEPQVRELMGESGQELVNNSRGAMDRLLAKIAPFLPASTE